jgi:hypothetical protein
MSVNKYRDLDGIKFEVWDSKIVVDKLKGSTLNLKMSDLILPEKTVEFSLYKDN